jgi:hypothetical protein
VFYGVATDLSSAPARTISVVDGINGYQAGKTIRLRIDIRDRNGGMPRVPIAVHVSVLGSRGGYVRLAGQSHRCKQLTFFWSRRGRGGNLERGTQDIDYTIGSEASIAGILPDNLLKRQVKPLWKATERLRIAFGETNAEKDEQHRDGEVEYPVRPEGEVSGTELPNLFPAALPKSGSEARFFGPNLEPDLIPVALQPFREYLAYRDRSVRSDEIVVLATSRRESGSIVTNGEQIPLRRLAASDVFVGSFIFLPEGYATSTAVLGAPLEGPIVTAVFGRGAVAIELPAAEKER